MAPNRLDLHVVRGQLPDKDRPRPTNLAQLVEAPDALAVSRRDLLGLAGAAAVTLPPGGELLQAHLLGPVEYVREEGRVRFRLEGEDRWSLDPAMFGGTPRLGVDGDDDGLRLSLRGATFPGTTWPADMTCHVRRGLLGYTIRISLAFGAFLAEMPLHRWLSGAVPLRSRVMLSGLTCPLDRSTRLLLHGPCEAALSPTWELRLLGANIGALLGAEFELRSDDVTLCLPGASTPSLMQEPLGRRTLVSLSRGAHRWPLQGALPASEAGELRVGPEAFDLLQVEVGQDGRGRRGALLASCRDGNGQLQYLPASGLRGGEGTSLRLALQSPRYAVAFDAEGNHSALLASLSPEPVWAHGADCSFRLAGGQSAGTFELQAEGGRLPLVTCEPTVLGVLAPLTGAIVAPAVPSMPLRVSFEAPETLLAQLRTPVRRPPVRVQPQTGETKDEEPAEDKPTRPGVRPTIRPGVVRPETETVKPGTEAAQPGTGVLRPGVEAVKPERPGIITIRPDIDILRMDLSAVAVPVVRARDLLSLTFEFRNLKFQSAGTGQAALVRADSRKPAYLIANFPPQHIAEQAFLEAAPELPGAPGASGDETPTPPPVQSRLSGPSRLVFRLPNDAASIPYTLEGLLNWASFELSVAPTALPPPELPALPRGVIQPRAIAVPRVSRTGAGAVAPRTDRSRAATPPRPLTATAQWQAAAPAVAAAPTFAEVSVVATPGLQVAAPVVRQIAAPGDLQTAIEAPYRLILSPNDTAGWLHATGEVSHDDRVELWHTRLGVRGPGGQIYDRQYVYSRDEEALRVVGISPTALRNEHYRTLRAIWSPDYSAPNMPTHADAPFRMSLDRRDRCELVWLTADFSIPDARRRVVRADRFMLSALGVWMDTRYADEVPLGKGLSVEEWRHQAQMGRDQYVKVVYKGFLFPFGHRASLVKITERKFQTHGNSTIAYLRQRFFIVVREPERTYPAYGQPNDARAMPLRRVQIQTLVTPSLNQPQGLLAGKSAQAAFWPIVGGKDFLFHMVAEDWDGQRSEFTTPVIFVGAEDDIAFTRTHTQNLCNHYNAVANEERRTRDFAGQKLAYAESTASKPGDTTLETDSITFKAELPPTTLSTQVLGQNNQLCAYPALERASAHVSAVQQFTGTADPVPVSVSPSYVNSAYGDGNTGQVYLELLEATGLDLPPERSGGMVTPNMMIRSLSRRFGPTGGKPTDIAAGQFKPEEFFEGVAAKILGGIDLAKIISAVFGDGKLPAINVRPIYPDNDKLRLPEAVEAIIKWEPEVHEFIPFKPLSGCRLTMDGLLRTQLTGTQASTYRMDVNLVKFSVDLSFIAVNFNRLRFLAETGKKADVDVDIADVVFGGPLEFVNELRNYLRSGELGGVCIDITGKGITAGFALQIPSISVGVMSLQNISLGASLTLPFTGDPMRVRFNFCERSNPFLLTVYVFGGGGFFAIELLPTGLDVMEASFEFGGNFSLNIGVASGGAYIMAGVYFKLDHNEDTDFNDVQLTGYLRCGGHLSVLGLITISAEFYMALTYASTAAGSRVWGEASLKVSIKILFFSTSVTLRVEREFAGSSGASAYSLDGARLAANLDDPTTLAQLRQPVRGRIQPRPGLTASKPVRIDEMLTAEDWSEYCAAFG